MNLAAMSKQQHSARHGEDLKLHREATFGEVSNGPVPLEFLVSSLVSQLGTRVAVNKDTLGVATDFAGSARRAGIQTAKRGGARNRADRESHSLTMPQVANLVAAKRHAVAIGLPFTRMISVHWGAAGVSLGGMVKATGQFIDLMTKALKRHGSSTAWLWVHENGEGKGWHCHMLVHVPAKLVPVLTRLQRGWLRRITGQAYRKRVIHSRPIGGRLGLEVGNPDLHEVNLATAFAYVLKGADPKAASQFALDRLRSEGLLIGKRCGTSQNIGPKARKGGR